MSTYRAKATAMNNEEFPAKSERIEARVTPE